MRCFIWFLLCSCLVFRLSEGLQCLKCSKYPDGEKCFEKGLTTETCNADQKQRQVCGTIVDYRQPDGAEWEAYGIERGCYDPAVFQSNPGCSPEYYITEKNETVSTCTRSCNSDNCNNWPTSPSPK